MLDFWLSRTLCQKFFDFKVIDFENFDCHSQLLPIEFEVYDTENESKKPKPVFLRKDGQVLTAQETTEACFPFKEFNIDKKYSFAFLSDKLLLIEPNKRF